jgi:hypothetical protein
LAIEFKAAGKVRHSLRKRYPRAVGSVMRGLGLFEDEMLRWDERAGLPAG